MDKARIRIRENHVLKLNEMLVNIGNYVAGKIPDEHGIAKAFWSALASYLFHKIHEAYIIKSHGGTDELGNSWPPLAERTIKTSPQRKGNLKRLSDNERRRLRRKGTSISDDYLTTKKLIMRETDRLMNSLMPANLRAGYSYSPKKDQLFEFKNGKATIGTEVEYAKFHNETRPVIPENVDLWYKQAVEEGWKAAKERVKKRIKDFA
jgi:hypothetical protein